MPNRSRKPADPNRLAKAIVSEVTSERRKNPAAVALGRLGGLKGGKARARKLDRQRRKEIAQNAAAARWGKREQS